MTKLKLSLTPDLTQRLTAIAGEKDLSLDDCLQQAVLDYIESWEDFRRTVQALENGEDERTVLRAVND